MSEIDITQYIPLKTDEGSPRVARTSPTSDDSSAQQQSPDQNSPSPKKTAESSQKPAVHETAVTISATLSNLEAGNRIKANYLGIDGQDRPLITAKTGTYTVKYAPEYQPEINKIPQGAVLEVRILKIDREIEARLMFRDPGAKDKTAIISLAVTLELTSLGDAPPRSRAIPGKDNLPPGQQQLSYQATDLYRAENIARESDRKLNQLPPSATSPNYTLYEKAVPQKDRPAMASATRPPIAGNALIAQEQATKTPLRTPDTGPAATTPQDGIRSVEINFAKLLHKNTLATVIKTFAAAAEKLPEIIQKNLGNTGILTALDTGRNFTLKIESIMPPDSRLAARDAAQPTPAAAEKTAAISVPAVNQPRQNSADTQPQTLTAGPRRAAASPAIFSGIIVAPGENARHGIAGTPDKTPPPGSTGVYANRYNPASLARPKRDNAFIPLYIATPVSIIKFLSPVGLKAGTVVNFSLPDYKAGVRGKSGAIISPERHIAKNTTENIAKNTAKNIARNTEGNTGKNIGKDTGKDTGKDIGENIIGNPRKSARDSGPTDQTAPIIQAAPAFQSGLPIAARQDIQPQPLGTFVQNWQSLSEILSVMAPVNSSIITQSLNGRLPEIKNPARMTTGILFFLAALGAKNPARLWLGPDIARQLEQGGQKKLLKMLDHDMQRIFKLGATTASQDWRPALFPLQIGSTVNAVPVLTRQIRDDTPDGGNGTTGEDEKDNIVATRFIVELDLSQFGPLQLDGLLKQQKLNIIIRSGITLPVETRKKMTEIYTTTLDISGYSGDLQFRNIAPADVSVSNIINQKIHVLGL